jgi:hypothetical protein
MIVVRRSHKRIHFSKLYDNVKDLGCQGLYGVYAFSAGDHRLCCLQRQSCGGGYICNMLKNHYIIARSNDPTEFGCEGKLRKVEPLSAGFPKWRALFGLTRIDLNVNLVNRGFSLINDAGK